MLLEKFFKRIDTEQIYPREYSFGAPVYRRKLYSETQLQIALRGASTVFASIFSDFQIAHNTFDVLFAEIDEPDFTTLAKKTVYIYGALKKFSIDPVVFYSGSRSSHFYVAFENMTFKDYGVFARMFWQSFDFYDWLDFKVVGDKMRLSRVPGSLHNKTGLICLYVPDYALESEETYKKFIKRQELCESLEYPDNTDVISEYKKVFETKHKDVEAKSDSSFNSYYLVSKAAVEYPVCIRAFLQELLTLNELDHYRRIQLVLFFKNICKSEDERMKMKDFLFSLFKEFAKDFDAKVTRYQIDWIFKKDYSCYSCAKSKTLNMCSLSDNAVCKFYPSINKHLKFYNAEKIIGGV